MRINETPFAFLFDDCIGEGRSIKRQMIYSQGSKPRLITRTMMPSESISR